MHRVVKLTAVLFTMIFVPVLVTSVQAQAGTNWPQFRGPEARGVSEGDGLPDHWSTTENVEWKTDLPGKGWSSPIVWGNRVFLTAAVSLGEMEAAKKGLYSGGDRPNAPRVVHQWKVFCLDLETGRVLWQRQVHEGKPAGAVHIKNSLASETPVTDGEHVYVYFGNVGIYCLDFEGNIVWQKKQKPRRIRNGWGTAASPVLHGNRLYVLNDNDEDSYLLALDKQTGDEVWRTMRDEGTNWSTPYIWENDRRVEIVTVGTGKVRSYNLDGNLLWSLEGMSSITISTPYEYKGLLYISSGYLADRLRPVYAIRPGADGDISLTEDQTANEWIVWCQKTVAPYNPSTLVYEDRLYVLQDIGTVACYDAVGGTQVYKPIRIPKGRRFTVSPWAYGGKVFCLNEDGVTFVLKAGDEFEILQTNVLPEDDMYMASPAMAGDRLLIRSSAGLYCIRNGAGGN